jgi:hypothetical protein
LCWCFYILSKGVLINMSMSIHWKLYDKKSALEYCLI